MDNERRRYKRYLLEDGENLMPRTTALRRRRQHEVELETDSESDHDHQDDAPVAGQLLDFVQNQDVFSDQDSDAHAHRRADSDPESVDDGLDTALDLPEGQGRLDLPVPDLPSPHIHSISSLSDDHHDGHSNSSRASEDINLHEDWSEGSNDEERRHGMWEEDDIDLNHDSDEGSEDGQRIPEFEEERNHMQVPNGNDAISSEGSDLTKMDSLLAVLAYSLKHHLTGEALQDLIHLINLHCPQSLPQSKYLFNKVLNNYKDTCEFHFYCDCFNYLGKIGQLPERCDYCGEHVDHEIKIKEGKFFLTMPLAQQLKYLLESTAVGTTVLNRVIETGDSISDITDGELYQELVTSGLLSNPNNLSLTWNTDGVPVFKSSRSSMWPILCLINELPQKMRSENIILTALWFGDKKPDMSVFLKPFVDESNILSSTGLKWTHIGEEKTSRVFPLVCSVDSVARPALQNFVQFNGFYGCSFCKQKGTYAEGAMKYPYVDPPAEKRTPGETMRQSILAAESGRSIEGVKGVSVLSFLVYFNIISSLVPDYMHAVCLGTIRRFLNMWLDPANRQLPFYVGNRREEINKRILSVKVCKAISRVPRSLSDVHFWKASEWRTFMYISPVILKDILPNRYLAHWTMLIGAIYNLNSTRITPNMLKCSEFMLRKFVMFIEPLYGIREATFNVHLLLHLTDSVKQWGPLWATSAFPFESYNGYIKKLFSGTSYVPQQIFQSVCRLQTLVRNMSFITSLGADAYVSKMIGSERILKNISRFRSGTAEVVCLGRSRLLDLSQACQNAVQQFLGEELLVVRVECFERFVVNNVLFSTKQYSHKFKRNDSTIKTRDFLGEIIHLISFQNHNCVDLDDCICYKHVLLLVDRLDVNRPFRCVNGQELGSTIDFINEVSRGSVFAMNCDNIITKGILLSINDVEYVATLPNMVSGD